MSIASRISSIEEHIKESYQELEGIGIDTTEVNKNLENIPKLIDRYWETLPKVTGEGTSITLDNTKEGKMKINLKGNTSQFTTTGKNKYNATRSSTTTNAVTYSGDTSRIYINGTPNNTGRIFFNKTYLEAGTYTFSMSLSSGTFNNNGNNQTYLYLYKGTESQASWDFDARILLTATIENVASATFTISEGSYYYLAWYLDTSYTWTNAEIKYQVESGSSFTSFEPYTNGASPNPDYPQDVHVVSGDNTINICGKNLFDYQDLASKIQTFTISGTASNFTLNGIGTYQYPISISTNEIISGSWNSTNLNGDIKAIYEDDTNANILSSYSRTSTSGTISFIPTKKVKAIQFRTFNLNNITINNLQIELGSTATTYEPYQEQNYSVNLGSMELCKIRDYQDSIVKDNSKWYLNKQIGKVVLNGTENWTVGSSATNRSVYSNQTTFTNRKDTNSYSDFFSDNFSYLGNAQGVVLGYAMSFNSGQYARFIYVQVPLDVVAQGQVDDFKTWLSTHNTTVYYVLATPTTTEITDSTLISQLDTLESAMSYKAQTNVSQVNNDNASILNATALSE